MANILFVDDEVIYVSLLVMTLNKQDSTSVFVRMVKKHWRWYVDRNLIYASLTG